MRSRCILVVLFLWLSASHADGQAGAPFVAIPAADAPMYRIDLARLFFDSPAAERALRADLSRVVAEIERLRGRVGESAELLEHTLMLVDTLRVRVNRHSSYLTLRTWTDVRDNESREAQASLIAEFGALPRFIGNEIRAIPEQVLNKFFATRGSITRYRYEIESYRGARLSPLDSSASAVLRQLNPLLQGWQTDLYNQMFARRADAKQELETYAFILIQRARAGTQLATLAGSGSAAERAYAAGNLTPSEVNGVVAALAAEADLHKGFERSRVAYLRKTLGRDSIGYYTDYLAPPASDAVPRFTIDEARANIEKALMPLGREYTRELHAVLDPANRRLDIVPGPNRAPGGTTLTSYATSHNPSVFYMQAFTGSVGDVMTLVHEAGHAAHFQMMAAANVPAPYSSGPQYLTEAFSYLNELLLAHHMFEQSAPGPRKIFWAEQFLDRAFQAFTQARDVEFEAALYDSVAAGTVRDGRSVTALFTAIGSRYSIWHTMDPEAAMHWIRIPHYFRSPFYRVNYLYARLLALRLFAMYQRDPGTFATRYSQLLRGGFSASASDLFRDHLGIASDGQALVQSALAELRPRVAQLEELYDRTRR